jgi:hypothetical protein
VRDSTKRAAALLVGAGAILGCLAYIRVLATGELHDKYVYSDMGALIARGAKVAQFVPFTSASDYRFYALPTRTRGNAIVGDPNEFVQLIALDTLCSGEVCLWDPDKKIDVKCSQISGVLQDERVVKKARDYLRSSCVGR